MTETAEGCPYCRLCGLVFDVSHLSCADRCEAALRYALGEALLGKWPVVIAVQPVIH